MKQQQQQQQQHPGGGADPWPHGAPLGGAPPGLGSWKRRVSLLPFLRFSLRDYGFCMATLLVFCLGSLFYQLGGGPPRFLLDLRQYLGKEGRREPVSRATALPVCFEEELFVLLDLRPPGRGRRVLLGAAAPRSTPFHPPPATPLAPVFAWTSLWPGQFLGKTDACHKPLGNRHHAHPSGNACTKERLATRFVSGRSASRARSFGQGWKLEAGGSGTTG